MRTIDACINPQRLVRAHGQRLLQQLAPVRRRGGDDSDGWFGSRRLCGSLDLQRLDQRRAIEWIDLETAFQQFPVAHMRTWREQGNGFDKNSDPNSQIRWHRRPRL